MNKTSVVNPKGPVHFVSCIRLELHCFSFP